MATDGEPVLRFKNQQLAGQVRCEMRRRTARVRAARRAWDGRGTGECVVGAIARWDDLLDAASR